MLLPIYKRLCGIRNLFAKDKKTGLRRSMYQRASRKVRPTFYVHGCVFVLYSFISNSVSK